MNISKMMKRKRDEEERLRQRDPKKTTAYSETLVGEEGSETTQQTFITETYITEGDNVTITQEGNITYIGAKVPDVEETRYYEPLTNGDGDDPELMFSSDGDVIMGEVDI